ncbi:FdhF/YdeP family oxidoreductase [Jeongeupia chitinilytica]|uniref:Molybdopterin oxidoreductase n=1 Tax=Jeongeupia chitinilytica TaxID=1041641 RepID=A0ABQ3H4Q6_9NEIS|nr:FdhF/YdeP family oxidoreductase [Jeongeupia chitinilytica]GHD67481.1 molybdopterin oxidoreductase [Jeongeupia chitinilytica]
MTTSKDNTPPAGGWGALKATLQRIEPGNTGTTLKALIRANQPQGFDCPGCAWPDKPSAAVQFCENGAKAITHEITGKRVTPGFFAAHTVSELETWDDYTLEQQGRLTEPMRYDSSSDRYVPIDWDDAFALIASHLNAIAPDEAHFYTSGRTGNETAFLYQLFVRLYGTNNLPDCSNMCHEPSGQALLESLGTGKGTVTLEDFSRAEAIFIFGQNPGTNHPRMLGELREAAHRGCKIVVFNPLRERGLLRFQDPQSPAEMLTNRASDLASHYYQPRIGGDMAIARALIKYTLEHGAEDHDFIAAHTDGFAAVAADVAATGWDELVDASGLSRAELDEIGALYTTSKAIMFTWGMGITQHKHAVATIQTLCNALLVRGNIGKPGTGACPVRGHSNVQGDRTMGINERPTATFLQRLGDACGFAPPTKHGNSVVESIAAMEAGRAKVFIALGGNFAAATPDTERTHAALRTQALTVHISTTLNRSHLITGRDALILPCLGRTEFDVQNGAAQQISVEDSMSMVHLTRGVKEPASLLLRSEPQIVAGIALATLKHSPVDFAALAGDYDQIRDLIAKVVTGFDDFNTRVRQPGGFYFGNSARRREWRTDCGKARFINHAAGTDLLAQLQALSPAPLLTLMTVRSHDQYNTTIYARNDRYRGIHDERRVLFAHPDDLAERGLADGSRVDIVSVWFDGERRIEDFRVQAYDIPQGSLAAYFPETNPLVPLEHHADGARTPASKAIPVYLVAR